MSHSLETILVGSQYKMC